MPIYEYECMDCGHQTEAWQKFSDAPLTECERCHGKLKKMVSQSSFHLKGTGWYVTDYAAKSSGNQTKGNSPSKQDSGKEPKTSAVESSPSSKETSDTSGKNESS